ncbi:synaptonemal complex protein 1-like [Halichondria panicea]|uniref:synaptonemal complex protein 1-like n=1 Tax=Halichondria panicea TaxID=6063 RepID=UPI00312B417C
MSLQMQTMSTSAPFFKPPMTSQGSNFFLSSTPQRQQQQSYTNTSQKVSIEMEQQSSDRLSALHTRLQLEAEKIRKWKNATESEIREKDNKLKEASVTIEGQRKSVSELQLKKESLSSRLRDEVSNQKEIHMKISSTRDMCRALNNHAVRLDSAICQGEQDRSTLTLLHQEKMDKFQGLLLRFQQLECGQREWMDSQVQLLTEEKKISSQLSVQCHNLEQDFGRASEKVCQLKEMNWEKAELSQKLAREIEEKTAALDSLQQDKATLQQSLCSKESELNSLRVEMTSIQQQLSGAHTQLNQRGILISDLQETLEQTTASHAEQLSAVQLDLSQCQLKCDELEGLKSKLELALEQTQCQLSSELEEVNGQLTSTQQDLTLAKGANSSLMESLSSEKELVEQLKTDKSTLEDQLSKMLLESEKLALKLENEVQEQEKTIKTMEASLEKQKNEHKESLSEWEFAESQLQACVSEMTKDKGYLTDQMDTLEQELKKSRAQLSQIEANYAQSVQTNKRAIAELANEKQAAYDEISTLKGHTEMLSTDKDELTKQCAVMEQLKVENTELNKTVESQHSQMQSLQTELEVLQSDLGSKNGELSGLIDKYKKEAVTSQAECVNVKKTLETQISELEIKCESTRGDLTALVDKYKTEAENAREEHEQTKSSFNEQVNDLCSVLEKYRAENQNILGNKDQEIESLRNQLNSTETDKRANEMEVASYKDKIDLLQSDLSAKNEEMKELLEAVECLQNKAKVSATPRRPSKPPSHFITPVHSTSPDTDEAIVSSTPKPRSTVIKKLTSATPKGPSRLAKDMTRSTPHRMYNHRVPSTPASKNTFPLHSTPASKNTRPLHSITLSGNKAKRMRSRDELESEEMAKFKELYPDTPLDEEEAVFKKPKTTKAIAVRKASSTTAKYSLSNTKYRPPLASRNGSSRPRKNGGGKKKTDDISWFDSDSVFGLGLDD